MVPLLNKLNTLSLRFIKTDKDIFFIAKDVERIKGRAGDHFKRSYQHFVNSDQYQPHKFPQCPPTVLTLQGDVLKSFKKKYYEKYKESLGSVNKLHVMNCSATYNYLFPEEVISQPAEPKVPQPQLNAYPQLNEFTLVKQLASLSSYTPNPFRREMTVVNTFRDQSAKTRRFDLCRLLENNTLQVFEVKRDPLTPEHVSTTLGDKGYVHLLQHTDHTIDFCFVAPSVLPAASRLLSLVPNVTFISIDDLVLSLLKEIKQSLPPQGEWFMKNVLDEFSATFNLDVG